MITNYRGGRVVGSSALQTSVAEQEIIPSDVTRVINFELITDQSCTVSFNGEDAIFIRENTRITIPVVNSCKIIEGSKTFSWHGISG